MPISKTLLLRYAFVMTLVVLLLAGVLFVVFRTDGFLERPVNENLISIDAITNHEHPHLAQISGHTSAPCYVLLELNGFLYASHKSEGTFQFDNVIIRTGENSVIAKCTLSAWHQSSGEDEKTVFLRVPQLLEPGFASEHLVVLSSDKGLQRLQSRKVTIDFSFRDIQVKLDAVLTSEDKRLDLIRNTRLASQSLAQFVKEVFNDFAIAHYEIAPWCEGATFNAPERDGKVYFSTRCHSTNSMVLFSNMFDQNVNVQTDWRATSDEQDEIVINVADYDLSRPQIKDNASILRSYQENKADIVRSSNDPKAKEELTVPLTYLPFGSLRNVTRTIRSSLYEVLPPKILVAYEFLSGALLAIPMIWTLAFFGKQASNLIATETNSTIKRTVPWLVAGVMVPFILYLIRDLAARAVEHLNSQAGTRFLASHLSRALHQEPGQLAQEDLRVLVLTTTSIVCISFLLFGIIRLIRNDFLSIWIGTIIHGISLGAVMILSIMTMMGLVLSRFPLLMLRNLLSPLVTWFVLISLVILLMRLWRPMMTRKIRLVAGLCLVIFLLLSIPQPQSLFRPAFSSELQHMAVLQDIETAFSSLQAIFPYVTFVGLLVLLKRVFDGSHADYHTTMAFGVLIFAVFVIQPGLEWLMLPIPLLLAIWIAVHYLMFSKQRQAQLGDAIDRIVEQRTGWTAKVLGALDTRSLRDTLRRLEKDKSNLRNEEYERRKLELESSIASHESELRVSDTISVTDVLLGVGPSSSNWRNGLLAVKRGTVLVIPLLLLQVFGQRTNLSVYSQSFVLLGFIVRIISEVAYWLSVAFFFGYFLPFIRGRSGLKKSLWMALMIIICTAVSDLALTDQLYRALQVLYFLGVLGLWIDYHSFRSVMRDQFRWNRLFQFETGWTQEALGASMVSFVLVPLGLTIIKEAMSVIVKEIFKRLG